MGPHWLLVFPAGPAGPLLHLGAARAGAWRAPPSMSVIAAVHDPTAARGLGARLREAGIHGVDLVVLDDASRLPLPDASLARVALEEVSMSAFSLTLGQAGPFAAEMARVVMPGGVVMLGVANPWMRPRALVRLPRWSAVRRAMVRHGFSAPQAWAPLPDERRPELLVPLERGPSLRYCLDHLIRKNSPLVRVALAGAGFLSRAGLSRLAVPYAFFYFKRVSGRRTATARDRRAGRRRSA